MPRYEAREAGVRYAGDSLSNCADSRSVRRPVPDAWAPAPRIPDDYCGLQRLSRLGEGT